MWRELITAHTDDATFTEPSTNSEVTLAGESLGAPFPGSLREALCESNGIDGEYGLGLLWPVSRILADNQAFRTNADFRKLYMPFECLLYFADAGNGDQFAFVVTTYSFGITRTTADLGSLQDWRRFTSGG
jgi:hypothetical protein